MERILIVEDSPTQREALRHTLAAAGYDVVMAVNGRDAWTRLAALSPTLVISDILMPEMDGYALCRAIKQAPEFARIPVVLLTSLSDPKDVMTALGCGADNFIGKPFAEDYLLSRIKNVISTRDLPDRDRPEGVKIVHDGLPHLITSQRPQIVDLLLSVYEMAMRRNEQLIRAQAELRKLHDDLERKFADRTRALRESNQALETFCYSIAHDLRAPLRSIQGFTSLLASEHLPAGDPTAQNYAGRTIAASARMDRMITDLLAYGRITHGNAPLRDIDIRNEFDRVLADFAAEISAKGAKIEAHIQAPVVWGNHAFLNQVIGNLLGNALKFSRPGVPPRIHFTTTLKDSNVVIELRDNGIGIEPGYLRKIFNVFEKAHVDPAYPGTGIGLAIVQKAVERMSGHIRVVSEPGEGTAFFIELPASEPIATPDLLNNR